MAVFLIQHWKNALFFSFFLSKLWDSRNMHAYYSDVLRNPSLLIRQLLRHDFRWPKLLYRRARDLTNTQVRNIGRHTTPILQYVAFSLWDLRSSGIYTQRTVAISYRCCGTDKLSRNVGKELVSCEFRENRHKEEHVILKWNYTCSFSMQPHDVVEVMKKPCVLLRGYEFTFQFCRHTGCQISRGRA